MRIPFIKYITAYCWQFILVAVLLGTHNACGAQIQLFVTGKLDILYHNNLLPPGLIQDGPFEAIISYYVPQTDTLPDDPHRANYDGIGAGNFIFLKAGESELWTDSLPLWIGNDVDYSGAILDSPNDTFWFLGDSFSANFDFNISKIQFSWSDPTRTVFASDSIPTSLRAQDFSEPYIQFFVFAPDPRIRGFNIFARVETIRVIPEPSSVMALVTLLGCVFLGVYMRFLGNCISFRGTLQDA